MTAKIGLVFWKDLAAAVWREDGWLVGPRAAGRPAGTPSTRPEASALTGLAACPPLSTSGLGVITAFPATFPPLPNPEAGGGQWVR